MFFTTCKNTLKNLTRTTTFWLILSVMIIVAAEHAMSACYSMYMPEYDEVIMDTDPRFVLEYQRYIIHITNSLANLLSYAIPIFAVVTTVIIAQRDFNDNFFEIEKSLNVKCLKYLLGRIITVFIINCFLVTVCSFFSMHLYVFLRNGVEGLETWEYLCDSTIRLLRANLFRSYPCIAFYITLTYGVTTIFKNSIVSALIGLGYAISNIIVSLYALTEESVYLNYLSPTPLKVMQYLYYYDTEWFGQISIIETSPLEVSLCLSLILLLATVFFLLSYLRIRKRTV